MKTIIRVPSGRITVRNPVHAEMRMDTAFRHRLAPRAKGRGAVRKRAPKHPQREHDDV